MLGLEFVHHVLTIFIYIYALPHSPRCKVDNEYCQIIYLHNSYIYLYLHIHIYICEIIATLHPV